MQPKRNIAARVGGWSIQHKKTAVFGWLAFVIAAFVIGSFVVGAKTMKDSDAFVGESNRAAVAMDTKLDKTEGDATERVLVQSKTLTVSDPRFKDVVRDVATRISASNLAKNVTTGVDDGGEALVSKDRHSALVQFDLRGDTEDLTLMYDKAKESLDVTAAAQKAHADFKVEQFGGASAGQALEETLAKDFQKAEQMSLPITLLILFLAFGALVAATVPVILALSAVMATFGLTALMSGLFPGDDSTGIVIMLIGMAVGVDYAIFYLRREREERAAGRTHTEALHIAAATSGRAVLISGLTVMIAMSGLFITGAKGDRAFAVGTMTVVAVAVLGSLTVLPALLSMLGGKVERGRIPFIGRRRTKNAVAEHRFWGAIVGATMRRPVVSAVLATGFLVALAIPALGMKTSLSGTSDLPRSISIMKTYDDMEKAFPGGQIPAQVVIEADDTSAPEVRSAIADLKTKALATGQMLEPIDVTYNNKHTLAIVDIPLVGDGTNATSVAAVKTLRNDVIPATVGKLDGVEVNTTGMTASNEDWQQLLGKKTPLVFAFVLSLAFLLLLVTFRSIVIPIKAIILNLLSVGAAFGIMKLIFQDGRFEDQLGYHSNGTVAAWIPLFLFVILFGLSMDYHVFILSRVREAFDRGMKTEDAVAHGIKTTAGVVTSAATVMVAVFSIFVTLSLLDMKEIGLGLAVAVLIDATIIRGVLLPASMKLLGDWNWYLPRWLEWLPKLDHEGSAHVDQPVPALNPVPQPA